MTAPDSHGFVNKSVEDTSCSCSQPLTSMYVIALFPCFSVFTVRGRAGKYFDPAVSGSLASQACCMFLACNSPPLPSQDYRATPKSERQAESKEPILVGCSVGVSSYMVSACHMCWGLDSHMCLGILWHIASNSHWICGIVECRTYQLKTLSKRL